MRIVIKIFVDNQYCTYNPTNCYIQQDADAIYEVPIRRSHQQKPPTEQQAGGYNFVSILTASTRSTFVAHP